MNKIHTKAELEAMSSKELVALYNEYAAKEVNKFADRKTAINRTYDMLPLAVVEQKHPVTVVRMGKKVEQVATPKVAAKVAPKTKPVKKEATDRSAAIAKTWTDPKVAAKRAERTHVKASGTVYRSVKEAFEQLGLPLSKHIKFRMQLKQVAELTFKHEGRQVTFKVVQD